MGCNGKKIILIGLLLVVINLLFSVLPGEVGAGTTPPGAITNLSALTGSNVGEIDLSWTAPGDNGYTGDIVGGKYRIDYSTDPLYNFTTYYYKIEFSTDTSPGDPQSYTLNSLNQTTYYIRVYTADEVPNWSPLSNGATAFPGAPGPGTVSLSAPTMYGYIEALDYTGGPQPDEYGRMTTTDFIKFYCLLNMGDDAWDRGFIEWDISSIPDDATITDVVFKYHGESNHASSLTYIYSMENQPSIQTNDNAGNQVIWDDAADGNAYVNGSSAFPELGESKQIYLGSSADSDLQSHLTNNWFAIGLKNDEGTADQKDSIYSSDYSSVNPPPTLYVTFTLGEDTTPPASITNLSALTGDVGAQVKLTWTAPGDDGTSGDILGGKYRIKYSQDSNYNWNVSDYDIEWTTSTSPGASQSRIVENLTPGATYYFRIWTGDEIPNWSTISNSANTWAYFEDIDPSAITDLEAKTAGQILLTWTAPGDNGTEGQASFYNIRYSSSSPFDWDTATVWKSSRPTTGPYNTSETETITGLTPGTTYYFRIKAFDGCLNWSLSNQTTGQAGTFQEDQNPMGGTNKGVYDGSLAFGDYDNDGDLDLAVSGLDELSNRRLILFKNNNGNFTSDQNPMGGTSGVRYSSLAFGDYDNDGDLDLAVSGNDGTNRRLILFKNNNGNFTSDQNPMGGTSGVQIGSLAFGDYDNDGDLDLAVSGYDDSNYRRLILFKNENGNFTSDQNPMGGTNKGVYDSSLAFGDYDNDGDLDLAVSGYDDSNYRRLILFKNENGNFTSDQNPMGGTSGVQIGSLAFGDYDNDGDLDLAVSGEDGTNKRLILFNNNNGTFNEDQNPMGGTDKGVYEGSLAFGDYDNDGDLDLAVSGWDDSVDERLILFKNNNGNFTEDENPMGGTSGVRYSSLAFGDYDNDGDLDLAVSGYDDSSNYRLIIYKNYETEAGNANTAPGLPQNLTGLYDEGVIKLSWSSATDGGSNPTPQDGLYYNIRVGTGTEVSVSSSVVTGIYGSPMMGNYLRPKLTDSVYGVRISSVGLTADTTYYWTVQAIDTPLNAGGWASVESVYVATVGTPQAPSAITNLSALTGGYERAIKLTWSAPGDDGWTGGITDGRYGIKYATYTSYDFNGPSAFDLEWSTNTSPGASEVKVVTGLTPGTTYYFRIWTADEVLNWSGISNGATSWAVSVAPAAITNLSALTGDYGGEVKLSWSAPGDDGWTGDISDGKYGIKYATYTTFDFDGPSNFDLEWSTSTSPGNNETKVVTGLTEGTTYYFRIWTRDEVLNWSGISNGATTWAARVAPAAITNLSALAQANEGEVKLSWSAPGDDGWTGDITDGRYGIKYATYTTFDFNGPSAFDLEWSTNTSPGASEVKVVTGLTGGVTYYFRLWTADDVLNWSSISNGATTWPKGVAPAAITDLSALTGDYGSELKLTWSAPGDDGWTGDITDGRYGIKYATYTSFDFNGPSGFDLEWSTSTSPGNNESKVVTGLTEGATYYFRIWTADDFLNWSGMSNGATAQAVSGTGMDSSMNYLLRYDGDDTGGSSAKLGCSVAFGDFDGDGKDDLAMGAEGADFSEANSGSVYIKFGDDKTDLGTGGKPLDISQNYDIRYDGPTTGGNQYLGTSVAFGDFDGDGKEDLAMGASDSDFNSEEDSGSVYIVYGNSSRPSGELGLQSGNYDIRYDGPNTGTYQYLGTSVAFGDFDGDGKEDLAMGANEADFNGEPDSGSVYIVYGNSSRPSGELWLQSGNYDIRYDGPNTGTEQYLGTSVAFGDFDGDGKEDLAMGAEGTDFNSEPNSGSVYIVYGNSSRPSGELWLQSGNYNIRYDGPNTGSNQYLGRSVSFGDFDGDGKEDLAMGAIGTDFNSESGSGSVYIVYGNSSRPSGELWLQSGNYNIRYDGPTTGSGQGLGNSVAFGDLDGDGKEDLAMGAAGADFNDESGSGSVYIVYGQSTQLSGNKPLESANYDIRYDGPTAGSYQYLGRSVSFGDFLGNGKHEIAMGADGADFEGTDTGSVYIVEGIDNRYFYIWDGGGGDNNWSTADNWVGNIVPGENNNVIFDGTSNKPCTIDISTTVANFEIQSGSTITITVAQDKNLTVSGDFILSTGTFNAGSSILTIGNDFSVATGTVFNCQTSTVVFNTDVISTLTGSTTFYGLKTITSGKTIRFTAGTTFYVKNMIDFEDVYLRSNTDGSAWYFNYSGSSQTVTSVDVKDSNALGGQIIQASADSTDSGNNINWAFGDKRYWVASSAGNWNDTNNWSLAIGGAGGYSVPSSTHAVIFNGANGKNGNATVNVTINIATITVNGYTGILNTNGYYATISSYFSQASGTISLGVSAVTIGGDFFRSGGTFNADTSTVTFNSSGVQKLTGSTTFYALRALTSGATLQFAAGENTYVTNMVDFENIYLRSTTDGSTWYFNYSGSSQTLIAVNVMDSNALGGSTMAADVASVDAGNNNGWTFADEVAPAAVTNLSALTGDYGGEVKLSWSAPGDDVWTGDITDGKYGIKYATYTSFDFNGPSAFDLEWSTNTSPGASEEKVVAGLTGGATYYFRIWTADEFLNWSGISNGATAWAYIEYSDPSAITDLQAKTKTQIELTWTAPGDDGTEGQASFYNIRYSTSSPSDWDTATVWKSSRATTGAYGTPETEAITGLTPGTTYYFRIKAFDDCLNWSLSNQTTAQAGTFCDVQNPMGGTSGVYLGSLAFGDYDNDGDLDLAVSGHDGSYQRLILFKNNNGNFTSDQNPMGGTSGVYDSSLAFGDYDNDGDLDLAVSGRDGSYQRLILFKNNNGNFTSDQNPMGGTSGVRYSSLAFGDYDNDGDLDLAVCGYDGSYQRLILFKNNNGNFTSDQNPMGGTDKGVYYGSLAFGDYDNDGDLDLAVSGNDGSYRRLILFKNNKGTFEVDQNPMGGTNKGVYYSSLAFGDYDNDGDLDLAVSGHDGSYQRLILFKNNNGNFTSDQNPMGGTSGVDYSSLAFGDYDNDGDLDMAINGQKATDDYRLILFKNNNGNFTLDQNPMGGTSGVYYGSLAFGDYDNDGDLDLAVSGLDDSNYRRLIIYKNSETEAGNANTVPGLPQNLTGLYDEGVIKLSWSSATDGGSNPTPQDGLYYNIRVGTGTEVSASSSVVTGIYGSPMMGNYLRPKLTNSLYGVKISSIGLTADTTYYWTVQAIDTPLNAGGWASVESIYVATVGTPQAPAAITNLSALTGDYGGEVKLSWSAPGDDGGTGDITDGRYGIKYATYTTFDFNGPSGFDLEWSTNTSPGTSESKIVTGLTGDVTYYFRIWTADEVLNWSGISNGATTWAQETTSPAAITNLSALTGDYGGEVKLSWSAPGDDEWTGDITDGRYGIKYATYTSYDFNGPSAFDLEWSTNTSPGASEVKVVTGLTPGTTYYFRIWTADEVLNWSGISNGATTWAKIVVEANRYWVGATANWNDADNWSATSGGAGGAGVPGAENTAIFDGGDTTSCQIDISSTVASVIIYSTYTATISINSEKSLTTSGSFEIAGGTFATNGEILDVGSYTQTGGIFNVGGSTVTCNGDFSVTAGTFNAGASVLVLDVTDGNATFTGDGYTFNSVIFQSTATVARTWTLGGGTVTINGNFQLKAQGNGNLTVTAITNNPDLDIGGSVDYIGTGAGTESLSMGEGTWTVGGNVDFSGGTVDASTSTFVLNGTSTQTLTMDGNNLNILQITNSSSDGVYFADNLSLSTFTATTGNTRLYFCGGSTFTFTNIDFNGQSESSRIVLRSTSTGTAWYLTVTGNQSVSYVDVQDSGASGGDTILAIDGTSLNSGNNVNWDFGPPAAITDLTGLCDSDTGDVTLSWSTPGDDGWNKTLADGSKYRIDYSTYVIAWSTNTYDVDIPTHSVTPHTQVSHTITGLTGDSTYYFRIWTADEVANWSGLSNGATIWVNPVISVSISTDTINLGVVEPGSYALTVSSVVVTNNGNIKQKFKLKIVSEPNATWESVTATSPGAEQYRYFGIFRSTQPATSDFLPEDSFSFSTERTSSSTDLARDADPDDQKGFNISPDNTRNLWFKFEAPTSTDITTTQAIPVRIIAFPYP